MFFLRFLFWEREKPSLAFSGSGEERKTSIDAPPLPGGTC
jgi:hypothetical protein